MAILLNLLDKYVAAGVPSNAAWDLIKAVWNRVSYKSWEDLYLEAFEEAIKESRPHLIAYAEEGEVDLDKSALLRALHCDLAIVLDTSSFSKLNGEEFTMKLARAMEKHSVLIIGGHNLSQDDYAQLVRNLIRRAKTLFREGILADESAFRRTLLDEAVTNQALLREVQAYLADRFDRVLNKLEVIEDKADSPHGIAGEEAPIASNESPLLTETNTPEKA